MITHPTCGINAEPAEQPPNLTGPGVVSFYPYGMTESWLPVVGHETTYEVSDAGRVRSLPRIVVGRDGKRYPVGGVVRKPAFTSDGYALVTLDGYGKRKTYRAHTLVLSAFVGPRPAGLECRHRNGDPADNRLENIEWATRSVNMLDRVRHGTHPQARRTACPQGHPYSGVNANGKRICRTCASKQRQAWLDKRKMVMA